VQPPCIWFHPDTFVAGAGHIRSCGLYMCTRWPVYGRRVSRSSGCVALQNSIQSNASARGALAGLRWGSETEIQPAPRSDSAPAGALVVDGAAAAPKAAPQGATDAVDSEAAAPQPGATTEFSADGGATELDDWGQHPNTRLGSVASLAGAPPAAVTRHRAQSCSASGTCQGTSHWSRGDPEATQPGASLL
jgi:hypothetical protein